MGDPAEWEGSRRQSASAVRALWPVIAAWIAAVGIFVAAYAGWFPIWLGWVGAIALVVIALQLRARSGPTDDYGRLLDAYTWSRHEDVLRLAERLRRTTLPAAGGKARLDVAFREAGALWALGRDDEAEARVEAHRGSSEQEIEMWWARQAGALAYAHRYDEAIDAAREAVTRRERPGTTPLMDLAKMLVQFERNAAEARAILEKVAQRRMTPARWAFLPWVSGMVAVEEQAYARAERELRSARSRLRWMPVVSRPAVDALLDAYLCLAECGLGRDSAGTRLDRARPWLEATGHDDLLGRCERALADRRIPYR